MMKRILACALTALALATVTRAAEPGLALAPIWTVQVDGFEPGSGRQLEQLFAKKAATRRAVLREHGVEAPPSWIVSTNWNTLLTFRSHQMYGELDMPPKLPADVQKILDKTVAPIDAEIQATLKATFTEVWLLDANASWVPKPLPSTMPQPGYIRIRTSRVKPDRAAEYGAALVKFRDALAAANYPVGLLTFFSRYGDGTYIFVLYANSQIIFDSAKPLPDVLAAVLGEDGAKELSTALAGSATRLLDDEAKARPDLGDAGTSVGWLGIPLAK